jgi:hypothetical protein
VSAVAWASVIALVALILAIVSLATHGRSTELAIVAIALGIVSIVLTYKR